MDGATIAIHTFERWKVDRANKIVFYTGLKAKSANKMKKNGAAQHDATKLDAVSGFSFTGQTIRASLISHGCTSSTDFNVEHESEAGMCRVSIMRSKPDLCRRAAFVVNVELDWSLPDDCVDLNVTLANPLLKTSDPETLIKRIK